MLIDNDTYQRETLSERPIRLSLNAMTFKCVRMMGRFN